jgi:hypothetical protein
LFQCFLKCPKYMDHLIFHPGGKKYTNSRSIVFRFGQNIDDTKRFYVCTEICRFNRIMMFWNDLWTIDQKERKA